ncbi:hypothetical protein JVT61DRAFT_14735 [Boletus reticuloceps]|uniref:N-acetyltransferase domain-containing protein n=1 Tax=Boletus reticuloceps TaxID=495285 RepID=A0A8I2YV36_9AGAM|nr:hypothetical protein JVT61DRAFT_14735 [Boletus reticuloceps]
MRLTWNQGTRVKATVAFLRQQLLTALKDTVLIVCYQPDARDATQLELVGHAFATAWDFEFGRIGWVTQLVVNVDFRNRYIATSLLQMLKQSSPFLGIMAIGLVSSHPAACHALAKYASTAIQSIDTLFYRDIVDSILKASPVKYLRDAKLRGSLFEENCTSGAVSSVYTNFYVDHAEPLDALSVYQRRQQWVLGELLDGHEFITVLPTRGSTSPVQHGDA